MTEAIFVDAGAFFAVKTVEDKNHAAALDFFEFILENNVYSFITTNFILAETVTLVKARVGIPQAIEVGKLLRNNNFIKIIRISDFVENAAWDIFDKYNDKEFSFVDCASFAVMKELGISKGFTFNSHYKQFGFQMLP